mmetsp:Transcript_11004/g.23317  ORF Transcript_11004/g.23317 Transcript_11004/m.23317 type:complete len:171 (-) Transcript_11004:551-1063(-)
MNAHNDSSTCFAWENDGFIAAPTPLWVRCGYCPISPSTAHQACVLFLCSLAIRWHAIGGRGDDPSFPEKQPLLPKPGSSSSVSFRSVSLMFPSLHPLGAPSYDGEHGSKRKPRFVGARITNACRAASIATPGRTGYVPICRVILMSSYHSQRSRFWVHFGLGNRSRQGNL